MKPIVVVSKADIENEDLCKILLDARYVMLFNVTKQARLAGKTASEIANARMEVFQDVSKIFADCMRVGSMKVALEIVQGYVDIEIE